MFGALIFLTFFILFTIASMAIPTPLFPGNLIENWVNLSGEYEELLSAITNGLVYGLVVWLVSLLINKQIEKME